MLKKKTFKIIFIIFACLFLFALLFVLLITRPGNEPYERNKDVYRQSFGILTYETLRHKPSQEDEELAEPILENIKDALAYIGANADTEIEYPYNKMCVSTDMYHNTSVDYEVDFITFFRFYNRGYVWLEYSIHRYSADGTLVNGSRDALVLVRAEKTNNRWTATDIIETA